MIELTEQQWQEIGKASEPVRFVNPSTHSEFYLVSADVYSLLQTAMGELNPRDAYLAIEKAFAPGWDDPRMAQYDDYEKHKP